MADERHRKKLGEGVATWNQWRAQHPEILPDLRKADIHGKILSGIDFRHTHLDGANLYETKLTSALLNGASLSGADLTGAKLHRANLHKTYFRDTILQRTNFHNALLIDTLFLNVDLSETLNLETAMHLGPSTLGLDTIQRSKGNISMVFLRGAGVSEQLLACLQASGKAPFAYATCFISHASHDRRFVEMLYGDLLKEGVMCWYAPESMNAGENFRASIAQAVQSSKKVLVVLSKHALESGWVESEVELARQKEGKKKKDVLVPIRLDSAILNTTTNWATAIRTRRHIRSFENWQQPSRYQKMFQDLLNDLRK